MLQNLSWVLLTAAVSIAAAQPYDVLLKGGHLIDPKNAINERRDVAIAAGKIARVAADISADQAKKVIDVTGLYVTPGLIDIHVHVYAGTGVKGEYTGDRSVFPDGHTFRSGVTTVVDAGTSGWRNFPDFKQRIIDHSKTRVLSELNIVGKGMGGRMDIEQDVTDMDAKETAKRAKEFPEQVVGIKTAHFAGPEWVAVDRAVEAGKIANIPVMVDFGTFRAERPFEELVTKHLRRGDMYTHMYIRSATYADDQGNVLPYAIAARKRGVKFDVGHGAGSFSWSTAIPALKAGFVPDSISTDLHISSMNAGMKDMTNVMSKILIQGVSFADIVKMSTWNPAQQIKRPQLGHLSQGASADIAVLRIAEGKFGFVDSQGARAEGTKKIICELTLRDGAVVWDLNGRSVPDWQSASAK